MPSLYVLTAALGAWHYTSPATNNTYIFNSSLLNQADAQSTCKVVGGHLVAWLSLEEQVGAHAACACSC
jgi:hypothetical protein